MGYLEYKATVWVRVPLHSATESQIEELKQKIDNGSTAIEALNNIFDDEVLEFNHEHDTETEMDLEDNNYKSTIEIYNDEGEVIFENGSIGR